MSKRGRRRTRHAARQIHEGFGWQQCEGKKVYKSVHEAREASKQNHQRYYVCQVCTWWHLTSK